MIKLPLSSTNNGEPLPSKAPLKTELQVLRLSDDAQTACLETLRYIHGQDFQLANKSTYKDKGTKIKNGYWQERGNLVVQGGCDYSNIQKSGCESIDRNRMLALLKIESYGFPKSHCSEALEVCKGNVDDTLELLYTKYFPEISGGGGEKQTDVHSLDEVIEMRQDEMSALQSIYDTNTFEEQEPNKVWLLKLKVDHLLKHSPSEKRKMMAAEILAAEERRNRGTKKLEPCRNLKLKGSCKYGNRCKYSHKVDEEKATRPYDPNVDPNWFFLEIRFSADSIYPFEAPMVFLKTTCPDIPHELCLRLTRRIVNEARDIARDEMPSVYTIAELLQMDEEMAKFLKNDRHQFLDPKRSLFYVDETLNVNNGEEANVRPTHYARGAAKGEGKPRQSPEQLLREDWNLVQKFMDKQKNANYKNMLKSRQKLPAWSMMTTILETVARSQVFPTNLVRIIVIKYISFYKVVVISGETGCGKSTQVPQFFLDDWLLNASTQKRHQMRHVEVICTQPRRISAIGVAERVADERSERVSTDLGKLGNSSNNTFSFTTDWQHRWLPNSVRK